MEYVNGEGGQTPPKLVEYINPRLNKWRVRWNVENQTMTEDDGTERPYTTFIETDFNHKPTLSEVKDAVLGWYNTVIDEKIKSGYTWNGISVWLSSENQFNYKAAYDLAVQSNGSSLPITFKFGTTENPIYHEFTSLEDLTNFYSGALAWINTTLSEGWQMKDTLDWSDYESLLA